MLDRLYAIKRPMEYRALSKKQRNHVKFILLCWLAALINTLPLWFDTTIEKDLEDGCKCFFALRNVRFTPFQLCILTQTFWLLWSLFTCFLIPAGLIIFSWITMHTDI